MPGPLRGTKVVEIGGLGPAPFCCMVLADLGADVLRVERPDKAPPAEAIAVHDTLAAYDYQSRGRLSAGIDLKHPDGVELVRRLAVGRGRVRRGVPPRCGRAARHRPRPAALRTTPGSSTGG